MLKKVSNVANWGKGKATTMLINALPGSYTIDDEIKPILNKMRTFFKNTLSIACLDEYKNVTEVDVWLGKVMKIDESGEFNLFMKLYMNFVLPMKQDGYKELLKRVIRLFDPQKVQKNKIVEVVTQIREFLEFLEKKYGSNVNFNADCDG